MSQTTALTALGLVQPLHGFTFALLDLACMRIIAAIVPAHLSATAQALYALSGGLATAVLILLSGRLYGQLGGQDLPGHGADLCPGAAAGAPVSSGGLTGTLVLKELEAVLAARVGWIDAAISPFAVAARNATNVSELVKRPASQLEPSQTSCYRRDNELGLDKLASFKKPGRAVGFFVFPGTLGRRRAYFYIGECLEP